MLADLFRCGSKEGEAMGVGEGGGVDAQRVRAVPRLHKGVRGQVTQGGVCLTEMREQGVERGDLARSVALAAALKIGETDANGRVVDALSGWGWDVGADMKGGSVIGHATVDYWIGAV
jgi:hypothetical protein